MHYKIQRSQMAASSSAEVLVPLGRYLEEVFRATCRKWPPTAEALPCSAAQPEEAEPAVAYVCHAATIGSDVRFLDPFYAIPLPDGAIGVSDYGCNAVHIVTAAGAPLITLGSEGSNAGRFTRPLGMALAPSGGLYVADDDRIQLIDETGRSLATLGCVRTAATGECIEEPEAWLPHRGGTCEGNKRRRLKLGELSEPNPIL